MSSVVMYHYIRKYDKKIKNLNFLHQNSFLKQLNYFNNNFKFYKLSENIEQLSYNKKKILLTFDDGLKEHLQVAKWLKKKNIKGIFFIPSKPLITKDFLTVHKIHLILGTSNKIKLKELFFKFKIEEYFEKKNFGVFLIQKNLLEKIKNKKKRDEVYPKIQLNIISQTNPQIIDELFNYCFSKKKQKKMFKMFYLNKKDILQIKKMGMEIGSHGHSHKVLSLLNKKEQIADIKKSLKILSNITKAPIKFFCYPYGGKKVYNKNTIYSLNKLSIVYAFSVESRSFKKKDNLLEIPRFDCNDFPFGKAFIKNGKAI